METYQALLPAGGVGLGVFLLFLGLVSFLQRGHETVSRLQAYTTSVTPDVEAEGRSSSPLVAMLDRMLAQHPLAAKIARNLAQADLHMTVAEYLLIHVALVAAGLLVGPLLLKAPMAGVLFAAGFLLFPQIYVSSAMKKRLQAFDEQLPPALSSLANSLRGGYGLVQAMTLVASEMPRPMCTEFQRVVTEVSYGLPYDTAFKNMLRRNPSTDLSMVVTAIEINLEVGGNLSEILDGISTIVRDRVRTQAQIRNQTAMVRYSGRVLTLLPIGLAVLIYFVNPTYVTLLWTTNIGIFMLGLAITTLTLGTLALEKIAKIDV